jgi:hypothetical protein
MFWRRRWGVLAMARVAPALLEALAVPGLRLWVSVAGHAGDVLGVRLHRRHVFRAVVWLLLVATAS